MVTLAVAFFITVVASLRSLPGYLPSQPFFIEVVDIITPPLDSYIKAFCPPSNISLIHFLFLHSIAYYYTCSPFVIAAPTNPPLLINTAFSIFFYIVIVQVKVGRNRPAAKALPALYRHLHLSSFVNREHTRQ